LRYAEYLHIAILNCQNLPAGGLREAVTSVAAFFNLLSPDLGGQTTKNISLTEAFSQMFEPLLLIYTKY
jgi:hypothetical protein